MLDRVMEVGISASYVLMDSWFTQVLLIQEVTRRGLHVFGMVKNDNKQYIGDGERLCLKALYAVATRMEGKNRNNLRMIRTELAPSIPVMVVFVRHRSKNEWHAILSNDLTLTAEEIIRIYRVRWEIEVFFKCAKSLLRLQKEFQGRSYDLCLAIQRLFFPLYFTSLAAQNEHGSTYDWRAVLFALR
ncbi:transposase [Paenibacillus sp. GYB004]